MKFREGNIIDRFFVEKNGKKLEVILRYPKMSDAKDLMIYINSLVREGALIGKQTKATLKEEKEFVKSIIEKCKKRKAVYVVTEVDGRAISLSEIRKKEADSDSHVSSIGLGIARDYRGFGIGKRLIKLLIRLGRENLGAEVIRLSVYSGNKNAMKLYKRLGFRKVGVIPKGVKIKGKYQDNIIMVLKK